MLIHFLKLKKQVYNSNIYEFDEEAFTKTHCTIFAISINIVCVIYPSNSTQKYDNGHSEKSLNFNKMNKEPPF